MRLTTMRICDMKWVAGAIVRGPEASQHVTRGKNALERFSESVKSALQFSQRGFFRLRNRWRSRGGRRWGIKGPSCASRSSQLIEGMLSNDRKPYCYSGKGECRCSCVCAQVRESACRLADVTTRPVTT